MEILQPWTKHVHSLLNNSSPTRGEVTLALRRVANAKEMRPDNLPAELLKLGVRAISRLLATFHGIILRIWQERTVPQLWKDAVIQVLHKKKDSAECSNHRECPMLRMWARFSRRSWPFSLAHTSNASVCCRSHSADFDQVGLRWT